MLPIGSGDFKCDGRPDLVTVEGDASALHLGIQAGFDPTPTPIALPTGFQVGVSSISDVNADGFDDLTATTLPNTDFLLLLGGPAGLVRAP